MRIYLALCCIALAAVAVHGSFCGGRHFDNATTCTHLHCNATVHMTVGCDPKDGVCTCLVAPTACLTSATDCAGISCGHRSDSPHCLDGYCKCIHV